MGQDQRNGRYQTLHRGDQGHGDAARHDLGIAGTELGDGLEGADHTGHCPEQTQHGGDGRDHLDHADAALQARGFLQDRLIQTQFEGLHAQFWMLVSHRQHPAEGVVGMIFTALELATNPTQFAREAPQPYSSDPQADSGQQHDDGAVAARIELQNAQLQLRDLEAYNRYMQSLVADQQNELGKLNQQLEAVQETRQGLVPLMLQMQADLEQLVQDDIPLRREDRLARVAALKATLARANVIEAEKFRQLLQAYQIEAEYGSRLDHYSAELVLDGAPRRVDVLALGRVSLLAMTADRSQAWRWSAEHKQWQALDGQWLSPIAEALEMAADKKVPQLLNVPLSVSRGQEAQS